jgi:RNA polymerase sigma factor (TIGR02999 family)
MTAMVERDALDVTALLHRWQGGDTAALNELVELVHNELRRVAHNQMKRERSDHTLQTCALINEAYLRLIDQRRVNWSNRAHFFAIASQIMRRILVDYARSRGYAKRGGGALKVPLDEGAVIGPGPSPDLVALDEALTQLAREDPRKARVVELRYFAGLTVEEVADVLKISTVTVMRDWSFARAWLQRTIEHGD